MEAVIFVGIQASGKSTFYQERFFRTHVRLNLDMLRTRYRLNVLVHACIAAKQRFVVDNTNVTAVERTRVIAPAIAAGFRITGYYFDATVAASITRNRRRDEAERVPPKGIAATFKRLELPSPAEGFTSLYTVRIDPLERFTVEEWIDRV